ncbi:hypothetical protein KAX02_05505 [candidate division WOR-3 bacterium]|nr:hypothetical protein [candidate division WOR-3 bacterium]
MDTKEAIEKVKNKYEGWMGWASSQEEVDKLGEERDKIIELLQRGEKYKAIVKEFKEVWGKRIYIFKDSNYISITNIVNKLEQKYFPKPSDNFTEKVMEKINKKVKDEKKA